MEHLMLVVEFQAFAQTRNAVSKEDPRRPACDAMICTFCNHHFCFFCEAAISDSYSLPGHGPHYQEFLFADRQVAVRNGWCSQRTQNPMPSSCHKPSPVLCYSTASCTTCCCSSWSAVARKPFAD